MAEKRLYQPVARFIKSEFNCFAIATTRGTQYGSIDVVGIRYVMGNFGGVAEVVAVEVKPERATILKALGQAAAYSVMADRCYLALHKPYGRKMDQDIIDMAAQLSVGLIEIGKRRACRVIVSSPRHEPIRAHKLTLIGRLGYVHCVVCDTLFQATEMKSQRARSSLQSAIAEEQRFRYWLHDLAEQRGVANKKYIYDRRHFCRDCVQAFSGLAPPTRR